MVRAFEKAAACLPVTLALTCMVTWSRSREGHPPHLMKQKDDLHDAAVLFVHTGQRFQLGRPAQMSVPNAASLPAINLQVSDNLVRRRAFVLHLREHPLISKVERLSRKKPSLTSFISSCTLFLSSLFSLSVPLSNLGLSKVAMISVTMPDCASYRTRSSAEMAAGGFAKYGGY